MHSRRHFLLKLVASAGAPALLSHSASAQGAPPPGKLDEADPVAAALGYKLDTHKVDATKYPMHSVAQKCSGCTLYQEKPGEALGPCTIFGGKLVTAAGWCVAFVKKPDAPAQP